MAERLPERRITVRLSGGLGNQLFQYAAARSVALRHNALLVLDTTFYDRGRHRQFELNQFPIQAEIPNASRSPRWLRQLTGLGQRLLRLDPPEYREPHYHFDANVFQVRPPVTLQGYFQSAHYFESATTVIRTELQPPTPHDPESQTLAQLLAHADSIALHVRRGDYVSNAKAQRTFPVCPIDYYVRALDLLPQAGPVVVVSDDVAWAKANLPKTRELAFAGEQGPRSGLADLWLLTQARHHVIANSTFSWWGAWLKNRTDGTTIAPQNWFQPGTHSSQDLIPADWQQV